MAETLASLAEAVVDVAAKLALGNVRIAENPEASARPSILAKSPRVPFGEMEAGIAARLGSLVEAADSRVVDLVEQTLRRTALSQDLFTQDISVESLFEALRRTHSAGSEPPTGSVTLLRACCWEIHDVTRALWNRLNAPAGLGQPLWRQLYSGGPIRSLASIQLDNGPYIVAGGDNGSVMLDQFTGTSAQVDREDNLPATLVTAGFTSIPITVCSDGLALRIAPALTPSSSESSISIRLPVPQTIVALAAPHAAGAKAVYIGGLAGILVWTENVGSERLAQMSYSPVRALAIVEAGDRQALISGDQDVVVSRSLGSDEESPRRFPFPGRVLTLAGVVIGSRWHVLAGGDQGALLLYDLESGQATELVGHSKPVRDIAVIEDADRPIAVTIAGSIRVWDLSTGEPISTALGSANAVATVRLADRHYLLAGLDSGIYVTELTGLIEPAEPWEHAGFSTDTATGEDRLGISGDVDTLAALMLAKEVDPPLAIGLFGDWGTGKSFFMSTLHKRIARLAADSNSVDESSFCGNVCQVEFNAWHYADANLWASLAGSIFDGLAATDEPASLPSVRAAREDLDRQRQEAEQKLAAVNTELESTATPIGFHEALRNAGLPERVIKGLDTKTADVELRGFVDRVRFLFQRTGWLMRLLMLAIVTVVVAMPLIVSLLPGWAAYALAIASAIGVTIVARATAALRTAEEIVRRADDRRQEPLLRLIEKYEDQKAEAISRIDELDRAHSVRTLAVERVAQAVYQRHEGIVSVIRRDLEELSRRLTSRTDVERIVLYIDDLDRCPPKRVVDVLQAVHLLLAFPLFVVVVGVDSRWLLRSLRHHYADLMKSYETPQNYLEKIFQISLCLRPMTRQGYADLVTAALLPELSDVDATESTARESTALETEQPGAPLSRAEQPDTTAEDAASQQEEGPPSRLAVANLAAASRQRVIAQALRLNRDERQLIVDAHPLIGTPRTAKRLVNVYRLLRAGLPEHKREQLVAGDFRAVIVLLGALVGFPQPGAKLLEELILSQQPTLVEVLESHQTDTEWNRLAEAIRQIGVKTKIPGDTASYARWATRVGRYSFRTGELFGE